MASTYVVEVFSRGTWRKLRGPEGGPWTRRQHAERIAIARAASRRGGLSTTEGLPHRVSERQVAA